MPGDSVTALFTVHAGVPCDHVAEALESLHAQTHAPDEVVLVEDGPLPEALLRLASDLERRHPFVVRVRLEQNAGAGVANQTGLRAASGDWIAKMDADDINMPERIERQLAAVKASGAHLCGAAMLEFAGSPAHVVSVRRMPTNHEAIVRRVRWNNPINHPTAFYRREVALAAGGYPHWRNMQDYGLVARMIAYGAAAQNLSEPQVKFRTSPDLTRRRRSSTARRLEREVQCELRELGLVSRFGAVLNVGWRTGFRMLPAFVVSRVSRQWLARPADLTSAAVEPR